jgi:hypothetical protein
MKSITSSSIVIVLTLFSATQNQSSPQTSPRDVLERFCELDAQGKQMSADGWQEITPLFSAPVAPLRSKIIVAKDFVVSKAALKGNRAEFYVEYIILGQIDSSLSFSHLPPVKVRAGFDLVLMDKSTERGPTVPRTQAIEPARWRIEGTPPEPHLTVEAAIHCVTELRSKALNDAARRNANKTIAILKSFANHP